MFLMFTVAFCHRGNTEKQMWWFSYLISISIRNNNNNNNSLETYIKHATWHNGHMCFAKKYKTSKISG